MALRSFVEVIRFEDSQLWSWDAEYGISTHEL